MLGYFDRLPARKCEVALSRYAGKIFSRYFRYIRGILEIRSVVGKLVAPSLFLVGLNLQILSQAIPKSAVILEKQKVSANRQMILWMPDPKKHPRDPEDDLYTCPDETRGHYYSGAARVSLVNSKTRKIINVIEIKGSGVTSEDDTLDLPYWIHRGYYDVPQIDKTTEGKPVLMKLKDYNDDGKAFEFALFDAVACMGLETSLIGYSEKQDKVIQYQTELKTPEGTSLDHWVDYFFSQKPVKKMFWKYEIDYRGRGGYLDKYEIHYDRTREMFFGTLEFEEDAPDSN